MDESDKDIILIICKLYFKQKIYPNNTRDVYLYIYSVSAYMG